MAEFRYRGREISEENILYIRAADRAQSEREPLYAIDQAMLSLAVAANSLDYLTELQRHAEELAANPTAWMPCNYRERMQRAGV
ncbi:MAG: hypothetical protein M3Z32_02725 [Acidobacteriota bacterium]|nr:hypothetical protein [Acidobacteriota bacterium]